MAIRQLTYFDDERFRKKSKPITKFDEKLWEYLFNRLLVSERIKRFEHALYEKMGYQVSFYK